MSALQDKKLKVGSLFAGIGGFDYGLELAGGFQIEWQIEIDPFCQQVLAKHWPNATRYGDIRECGIGRKHELSHVDVLCGGFPCQPHSLAGQRKASEDERDLWSEFYRLIRELEPRWVVAENVLGLLSSENGAFFGRVLRDLAQAGYDAKWCVLRASDVGAPHRRERVFLVAYPGSERPQTPRTRQQAVTSQQCSQGMAHPYIFGKPQQKSPLANGQRSTPESAGVCEWQDTESMAHTGSSGWQECSAPTLTSGQGHIAWRTSAPGNVEDTSSRREWLDCGAGTKSRTQPLSEQSSAWLTQSGLGGATHGLSSWLDGYRWPARPGQSQEAWEAPRVTVGKIINRSARLKALGNAIVPQLVALIGKAIVEHEIDSEGVA